MVRFINAVTVTGADDSIFPNELISISKEYPFVEFGILLSKTQQGGNRFPSREWLQEVYSISRNHEINLSGHLCGRWARDLCQGIPTFFEETEEWKMFRRIQLNFHAINHSVKSQEFAELLNKYFFSKPVIFQMDGVNEDIFYTIITEYGIPMFPLFDQSGGIGRLPNKWPAQEFDQYSGYAGGLSPDNLEEELPKIFNSSTNSIWIDAETHLRSKEDALFDLVKVQRFLEVAKTWVIGQW